MQRNSALRRPDREPLREDPTLDLNDNHTKGPFPFLNPTQARLLPTKFLLRGATRTEQSTPSEKDTADEDIEEERHHLWQEDDEKPARKSKEIPASSIEFEWRSRDNRKGRHKIVVTPASSPNDAKYLTPPSTNTLRAVAFGIWRMLTYYPYWDVSWLVAVIFTLGSVVWVINAFFVWLPLVQPDTLFSGETTVAAGWSAFVGATIFEVGSVLLMFEAVNANQTGCFGWALEKVVEGIEEGAGWRLKPAKGCRHHHSNKGNFVGKGTANPGATTTTTTTTNTSSSSSTKPTEESDSERKTSHTTPSNSSNNGRSWQWYPSLHDLFAHYIFELGFLACSFQMLGATVFWISGFTAIPQIQEMLSTQVQLNYGFWFPQVVGGSGFIISSFLFMLETQKKWYIPAPTVLGWHIGLWNLIGAFGFTLCGALGLAYANPGAQFEANLATFWGSWAFLVGSAIQWYESLDTHPVDIKKDKKGTEGAVERKEEVKEKKPIGSG